MQKTNPITSDDFTWSQDLGINQHIYTIKSQSDHIIAGGQSLSAAKINQKDGAIVWKQSSNSFRTTEVILQDKTVKTGGQYNNYAWQVFDQKGNLGSQLPKSATDIYGLKGVQIGNNFWDIYSTAPNGIFANYFEFTLNKNHRQKIHNTTVNLNPLAIAADKANKILYIAGWVGLEQHEVQLYKINLDAKNPRLKPLPNGLITSSNLVDGDQLVIKDMIWDHAEQKLVFTGDAHNYNSNPPTHDAGIIGSHNGQNKMTIKNYKFNGFIGDGSAETYTTILDLSDKYYLSAGSDSVSANYITNGFIQLVKKSDLSIQEKREIDILDVDEDIIRDAIIGKDKSIFIAGSGGIHNIGKSEDIFSSPNHHTFQISKPTKFKKRFSKKIINFNPSRDILEINTSSFGLDGCVRFGNGKNKRVIKSTLSKQNIEFLYDQKGGGLYFNDNGSEQGFGNGGIVAMLQGAPALSETNIQFN